MSAEENKANFRRFVDEAPNRGNLAVIDELFDPNVTQYMAGNAEPMRGIEGVKGVVSAIPHRVPGFACDNRGSDR